MEFHEPNELELLPSRVYRGIVEEESQNALSQWWTCHRCKSMLNAALAPSRCSICAHLRCSLCQVWDHDPLQDPPLSDEWTSAEKNELALPFPPIPRLTSDLVLDDCGEDCTADLSTPLQGLEYALMRNSAQLAIQRQSVRSKRADASQCFARDDGALIMDSRPSIPPEQNSALTARFDLEHADNKTRYPDPVNLENIYYDEDAPDSSGTTVTISPSEFKCDWPGCDALPFQTEYLLRSHRGVHAEKGSYYCPVTGCARSRNGKGFKCKSDLIRHGLLHDNAGYICPFCPEKTNYFPRADNLQRHVRNHHREKDRSDSKLQQVLAHPMRAFSQRIQEAGARTLGHSAVTDLSSVGDCTVDALSAKPLITSGDSDVHAQNSLTAVALQQLNSQTNGVLAGSLAGAEDPDDLIWKILKYCEAEPSNHQELRIPSIFDQGDFRAIEGHAITPEWMLRIVYAAKGSKDRDGDSGYGSLGSSRMASRTRDNTPDNRFDEGKLIEINTPSPDGEKIQQSSRRGIEGCGCREENAGALSPREKSPVSPQCTPTVSFDADRKRAVSCPIVNCRNPASDLQSTTDFMDSCTRSDSYDCSNNVTPRSISEPDATMSEWEATLTGLIADVNYMLRRARTMVVATSTSSTSSAESSPYYHPNEHGRGLHGLFTRHRSFKRGRMPEMKAPTEPPLPISTPSVDFCDVSTLVTAGPETGNTSARGQPEAPKGSGQRSTRKQMSRNNKRPYQSSEGDDESPEFPRRRRSHSCTSEDSSLYDRFPCIFAAGEPRKYTEAAHLKKYKHISLLVRHLHTKHHSWFVCEKCFTVFSDRNKLLVHYHFDQCIKSCDSRSCRRWRRASDASTTCGGNCLTTPDAQWRELFRTLYPYSEPPELPDMPIQQHVPARSSAGFDIEVLPSIEEEESIPSSSMVSTCGLMTPASSSVQSSQSFNELVECLQNKTAELQSKLSLGQQRLNDLEGRNQDLEARNEELRKRNEALQKQQRDLENLQKQNEALQKQQRDVENLLRTTVEAVESRTDPQSRLWACLRKTIEEMVPRIFDSVEDTCQNRQTQPSREVPSGQRPEHHGSESNELSAEVVQQMTSTLEFPSDFDEFLASAMPSLPFDENLFDGLGLENHAGF